MIRQPYMRPDSSTRGSPTWQATSSEPTSSLGSRVRGRIWPVERRHGQRHLQARQQPVHREGHAGQHEQCPRRDATVPQLLRAGTVCLKRSPREPGETQDELLRVCQTKRETRAFYNALAGVYDALATRTEAPVRQEGLDMLGVSRGERVLEIGFGTGRTLARVADAVGLEGHVYGVDLSDEMVRLTRELLRTHDLFASVGLTCADAERLPLASACVDAIFMSFVLELFDTPAIPVVLRECRRALRANGRIVVVAVSKQERAGLVLRAFEWTHRHFPNLVDCRPIYARAALETAGFRIERTVQRNMWVPVEIVLARR